MNATATATQTVTTLELVPGDVVLSMKGRTVASVNPGMANLGAALIELTDRAYIHAGEQDVHTIAARA